MKKFTSEEEMEQVFDKAEESLLEYADLSTAKTIYPDKEIKRVNVDFPSWMVERLDSEADYLGVNRQAIIKMFVKDGLIKASKERII